MNKYLSQNESILNEIGKQFGRFNLTNIDIIYECIDIKIPQNVFFSVRLILAFIFLKNQLEKITFSISQIQFDFGCIVIIITKR